MQIQAKVSIQTLGQLYSPGEVLTVSKEDGSKLIDNGHAVLIDDSDPEPAVDPAGKPQAKAKGK